MTPRPPASGYRGRFAPSPTGPLHQGSLIAALASYLDARAHAGQWLVRIEDIDGPRSVPGAAEDILETLAAYGMCSDAPPIWQSNRSAAYQAAFDALLASGRVYPCACTRREINDALLRTDAGHARHTTLAYSGTCRAGLHGRPARAWRLRVPADVDAAAADQPPADPRIRFRDRWQGDRVQDLAREVGDFALKRADGLWAYQLAVVVDDAYSGITDIVRGADLLDSTPRQIYLQRCLGLPTPRYLHVPVLTRADGEKLSKQHGAQALSRAPESRLRALGEAARFLGLAVEAPDQPRFFRDAIAAWRAQVVLRGMPPSNAAT
ncbi:tRNA glutamyl-Q(34) synthetase GluQRS [Robbsia sp. Bb-Pol-6]|uniref:Glutamyl-Q tRNA(Asp) synthetase n=1 Tax=Robbsia betulipollinis TaxID=2981849 RepID=A0ABT3ZN11_9BURK|nr:tRNA glutamyl-Q(34) synthetase GluQRS [Robbsia betulipollinis]MCY0387707.1 tRNA glutamyl-Q(34) synthetase GluQRS [Robbsia betulipollinis]